MSFRLISPRCALLLLTLAFPPMPAFPADNGPEEVQIPAGWDLSATLAFFRNLPLFDGAAFPDTAGPVLCRFSEARNETPDTLSFSNTYEFFRQTREGAWLQLSVQETSRSDLPDDPSLMPVETVADARQDLAVVPAPPDGAAERPEVSRLLAYVLDHRAPLVASPAGTLARGLNYTKEGKVRPPNYVQPRVTFLEAAGGSIAKIRVYGLEALLTEGARAGLNGGNGKALENRVLEISLDPSGAAQASLVPLTDGSSSPQ